MSTPVKPLYYAPSEEAAPEGVAIKLTSPIITEELTETEQILQKKEFQFDPPILREAKQILDEYNSYKNQVTQRSLINTPQERIAAISDRTNFAKIQRDIIIFLNKYLGDKRYASLVEILNEYRNQFIESKEIGADLLWNPDKDINHGHDYEVWASKIFVLSEPIEAIIKTIEYFIEAYEDRFKDQLAAIRSGNLPKVTGDPNLDWIRDGFNMKYGLDYTDVISWDELRDQKDILTKYFLNYQTCIPQGLNLREEIVSEISIPDEMLELYHKNDDFNKNQLFMLPANKFAQHWAWPDLSQKILTKVKVRIVDNKEYLIPKHMENWNDRELRQFLGIKTENEHIDKVEEEISAKDSAKNKKWWIAGAATALLMLLGS